MSRREVRAAVASSRRSLRGLGPAVVLASMLVFAVLGPLFLSVDPRRTVTAPFAGPSAAHLLGADQLGRDVLARLVAGGLPVVVLPLVSVVVSTSIGAVLGLLLAAGRRRGARAVSVLDVMLLMPPIVVLLVGAAALGPGTATLVAVVTLVSAPQTARYVRALAVPILATGYVEAAVVAGDPRWRILLFEVLPGLRGPLLADAGLRASGAVYLIATAGFLGLQPLGEGDNWASLLRDCLPGAALNPFGVIAPVLAIAMITVPANLLADRLTRRQS